jgi:hypothetical protein
LKCIHGRFVTNTGGVIYNSYIHEEVEEIEEELVESD